MEQLTRFQLTRGVVQYDTIRYNVFTCTQKATKWPA